MFQKKTLIVGFIVVVLGLACGTFFIRSNHKQDTKKVEASSNTSTITTQADWDSGSQSNIDSTSTPGDVKINDKALQYTDIAGNLVGSLINYSGALDQHFDLGQIFTHVSRVFWSAAGPAGSLMFSTDNTSWETVTLLNNYTGTNDFAPHDVRYVRIIDNCSYIGCSIDSVRLYSSSALATQTSQIDGSEGATKNFIQWETFTPTYTLQANTSVKFRLRTSPDAAAWTSWSGYQTPASAAPLDISAIVDSASGANKYLQVETTLENTDGASTPTIDSYSVQYHTDTKPNKPTAATAVVQ